MPSSTAANGRFHDSSALIGRHTLIFLMALALPSCGTIANEHRLVPIAGDGWRVEEVGPRRFPVTNAIYETDQLNITVWSWSRSEAGAVVVGVPIFPYSHRPGRFEIFVSIASNVDNLNVDLRHVKIFELTDSSTQPTDQNQLRFQVFGARAEGSSNIVPPYSGRDPYVASRLGSGNRTHSKIVVDIDLAQIQGGIFRLNQAISGTRGEIPELRFKTDANIELQGIAGAVESTLEAVFQQALAPSETN